MKKLLLLFLLLISTSLMADNYQTYQQMSEQFKKEITVKSLEIKTLNAKIKAFPDDASLKLELKTAKAQLKDLQKNKKIVDDNIKAQKAAEKAEAKMKKAEEKASKTAEKVDIMKRNL